MKSGIGSKVLAVSIALLIAVSGVTPCIAVSNPASNALNHSDASDSIISLSSKKVAVYSDYKSISDTSKTSGGLSYYADALKAQGYTVEQIYKPITSSKLDEYSALIIIGLDEYLSSSEKTAIEDFVENKERGLFLAGDCSREDRYPLVSWSSNDATLTLGEALDNTELSWTTGGDANWFGQTDEHYYGSGDAAQSGDISDGQNSWLQTTVTGPGTLSF